VANPKQAGAAPGQESSEGARRRMDTVIGSWGDRESRPEDEVRLEEGKMDGFRCSGGREGVPGTPRSYRGQEVDNVQVVDVNLLTRILEQYYP
jgi:hypothetical protein